MNLSRSLHFIIAGLAAALFFLASPARANEECVRDKAQKAGGRKDSGQGVLIGSLIEDSDRLESGEDFALFQEKFKLIARNALKGEAKNRKKNEEAEEECRREEGRKEARLEDEKEAREQAKIREPEEISRPTKQAVKCDYRRGAGCPSGYPYKKISAGLCVNINMSAPPPSWSACGF